MFNLYELIRSFNKRNISFSLENDNIKIKSQKGSLDNNDKELIKQHKQELISLLSKNSIKNIKLEKRSDHGPFDLTPIQEAYFYGRSQTMELGNVGCHCYWETECDDVDIDKFEASFNKLIKFHPMLRAHFTKDGKQEILDDVPYFNFKRHSEISDSKFFQVRSELSHKVYDPTQWPLFSIETTNKSNGLVCIHISIDLLILDVASFHLLGKQWKLLYDGKPVFFDSNLPTFRDYIFCLKEVESTIEYQLSLEYWLEKLNKISAGPDLPTLINPSQIKTPKFIRRKTHLDSFQFKKLKKIALDINITPSNLILGLFNELLFFYSNSSSFSVNLTIFNRFSVHPQVNEILGDFTSANIIQVNFEKKITLHEKLKMLQEQLFEDLDNSTAGCLKAIREKKRRDPSFQFNFTPLVFTSMLGMGGNLKNLLPGEYTWGISQTPQIWWDHQISEDNGELVVSWDVLDELFDHEFVNLMFNQFVEKLNNIDLIDFNSDLPVFDLPKCQESQRKEFNNTNVQVKKKFLHENLINAISIYQDKLAIAQFDGTELTFKQLGDFAQSVSSKLRKIPRISGLVIILMEKGWEQVVSALAILDDNRAYVPIDINLPKERIVQLINQIEPDSILVQPKFIHQVRGYFSGLVIEINKEIGDSNLLGQSLFQLRSNDLAYIIFTSGSTGTPKGVMINHHAAYNTICDVVNRLNISHQDTVLGLSSLSFDLSVFDIFGVLGQGGTLVIPEESKNSGPAGWFPLCEKYQINFWNSVPQLLDIYVDYLLNCEIQIKHKIKNAMLSGDWLPLDLFFKFQTVYKNSLLFSFGGATEASIWSIFYPVNHVDTNWKSIPYGFPMFNQSFYVLNKNLLNCPTGVTGDLYIGGVGLADGYFKDEKKTSERFIYHPTWGIRLYKTGDLGRFNNDGYIEFLGREDGQIKLRGYRVELGEIETAISNLSNVKSVSVLPLGDRKNAKSLVAYVIRKEENQKLCFDELKNNLSKVIPEYMIPNYWKEIPSLPLSSNGKVDRNKLPVIDLKSNEYKFDDEVLSESERRILTLINQFFEDKGIQKVQASDYINLLPVDSITVLRLLVYLEQFTDAQLPPSSFWGSKTILSFIHSIENTSKTRKLAIVHNESDIFEPFPLNGIQQAYFYGRMPGLPLSGVGCHYYLELKGTNLNLKKLEESFNLLIKRHPMMRSFVNQIGEQVIKKDVPYYSFNTLDLSRLSSDKKINVLENVRRSLSHKLYEPENWPLFEVRITKLQSNESIIHLSLDLLIADLTSFHILLNEWRIYFQNSELMSENLEITFRDYIEFEIKEKETDTYKLSLGYWNERVKNLLPGPALPLKADPVFITSPRFKRIQSKISKENWNIIKENAQSFGITPSVLIATCYSKALSAWSSNKNFSLNLTMFNRRPIHRQIDKIVGDFTSLTFINYHGQNTTTFLDAAMSIQSQIRSDLDHRSVSGVEVLREWGKINKENKLLPVVLTSALGLNSRESSFDWLGEIEFAVSQTPQVWIDNQVIEDKEDLIFSWDYVEDLFDFVTIQEMFNKFAFEINKLLKIQNWSKDDDFELAPLEQIEIFKKINRTDFYLEESDLVKPLLDLFTKSPNKICLVDKNRSYTVSDLVFKAYDLYTLLLSKQIKHGDKVLVFLDRSFEQLASCYAVMMTGAAFVPLTNKIPKERIQVISNKINAKYVLTKQDFSRYLPNSLFKIDVYNDPVSTLIDLSSLPFINWEDLAYIIFTSGSTGEPKGVMIDHRGALNTCVNVNSLFSISESDVLLNLSQFTFDLSIFDFFSWPISGAKLILLDEEKELDPVHWHELIQKYHVTVWNSVPALCEIYCKFLTSIQFEEKSSLKTFMWSGDWISLDLPKQIEKFFPLANLYSLGGATEASIWSIYFHIKKMEPEWKSIPYGTPLGNQSFYVLDDSYRFCPVGVLGNLYIGGIGLAKGYIADPEKTNLSFINHPVYGIPLYKTGDIGAYDKNGVIQFYGRSDFQVKINGYRVELEEIEKNILNFNGISKVIVNAEGPKYDKFLVAFIEAKGLIKSEELSNFLNENLPSYMVPKEFVFLEEFPLTSNGKVDRASFKFKKNEDTSKTMPRNNVEQIIFDEWVKEIGHSNFSIDTNFFMAGGQSKSAINIIVALRSKFSKEFPLKVFFENPTIKKLALIFTNDQSINPLPQDENRENVSLSFLELLKLDKIYVKGKGQYLISQEGESYLDCVAGFGTLIMGHNHPELQKKAIEFFEDFKPFHIQRSKNLESVNLKNKLKSLLFKKYSVPYNILLASTGTEAIEACIKHAELAFQTRFKKMKKNIDNNATLLISKLESGELKVTNYFYERLSFFLGYNIKNINHLKDFFLKQLSSIAKMKKISLKEGFHGLSSGSLQLTYSEDFRDPYPSISNENTFFVDIHNSKELLEILNRCKHNYIDLFRNDENHIDFRVQDFYEIGFASLEVIQGEGGVYLLPEDKLHFFREELRKCNIPIINDEIQIGLGRTGDFTAYPSHIHPPEYITFAKALGGGFSKISAIAIQQSVFQEDFMSSHGSTFGEEAFSSHMACNFLEILTSEEFKIQSHMTSLSLEKTLRTVKEKYPRIIADVRGKGLLWGIEFNKFHNSSSEFLKNLSVDEPEIFHNLIASYLLNKFRLRVSVTKTRPCIRFLAPSLLKDDDFNLIEKALLDICLVIDSLAVSRLFATIVKPELLNDPITKWNSAYTPVQSNSLVGSIKRVAHLGHLDSVETILRLEPSFKEFSIQEIETLTKKLFPFANPSISDSFTVDSPKGGVLDVFQINLPLTAKSYKELLEEGAYDLINSKINSCLDLAKSIGCSIVGFGGLNSVATFNCTTIGRSDLAVTSGNTLTTSLAMDATLSSIDGNISEKSIAVVGAKGNIGQIIVEHFLHKSKELNLFVRSGDMDGIKILKNKYKAHSNVKIFDDLQYLKNSEIIFAASSSAYPIIKKEHIGDRIKMICDVATPPDVDEDALSDSFIYIKGGMAKLENRHFTKIRGTNLPENVVFGCMAETIILGLEDKKENYSFGDIKYEQVNEMKFLAKKWGVEYYN